MVRIERTSDKAGRIESLYRFTYATAGNAFVRIVTGKEDSFRSKFNPESWSADIFNESDVFYFYAYYADFRVSSFGTMRICSDCP